MEKINLEKISSMDGASFEDLISNLLIKMGFVVEQTKKTADGGIDIYAYSDEPIISGKYVIQCKRSTAPISESVIRDLYGVMTAEKANKGILITNSRFTSPSITFAEKKPIELINGYKLVDMLSKYYDFENDDSELKIPLHSKLLFKEVISICNELKRKYEIVKNEMVLKRKKKIKNNIAYTEILIDELGILQRFCSGMSSWLKVFNDEPSQDSINISQFIKPKVESFKAFMESFYDNWEKLFLTICPEDMIFAHKSILKVYDSLFLDTFLWADNIDDSFKNPRKHLDSNDTITLEFRLIEFEPAFKEFEPILSEAIKIAHSKYK